METQTPNNNLPQNNEATQKKEWITPEMEPMVLTNNKGKGMDGGVLAS